MHSPDWLDLVAVTCVVGVVLSPGTSAYQHYHAGLIPNLKQVLVFIHIQSFVLSSFRLPIYSILIKLQVLSVLPRGAVILFPSLVCFSLRCIVARMYSLESTKFL